MLVVGAAGQVAEQHESGSPDEAAGHGVDQELKQCEAKLADYTDRVFAALNEG